MNNEDIFNLFEKKYKYVLGRIISFYKSAPTGCKCIWNANIVTKERGKIWYGDINITKDGANLKQIANELGETLYVLRESDCRFGTENDSIELLISRAVWNTNQDVI